MTSVGAFETKKPLMPNQSETDSPSAETADTQPSVLSSFRATSDSQGNPIKVDGTAATDPFGESGSDQSTVPTASAAPSGPSSGQCPFSADISVEIDSVPLDVSLDEDVVASLRSRNGQPSALAGQGNGLNAALASFQKSPGQIQPPPPQSIAKGAGLGSLAGFMKQPQGAADGHNAQNGPTAGSRIASIQSFQKPPSATTGRPQQRRNTHSAIETRPRAESLTAFMKGSSAKGSSTDIGGGTANEMRAVGVAHKEQKKRDQELFGTASSVKSADIDQIVAVSALSRSTDNLKDNLRESEDVLTSEEFKPNLRESQDVLTSVSSADTITPVPPIPPRGVASARLPTSPEVEAKAIQPAPRTALKPMKSNMIRKASEEFLANVDSAKKERMAAILEAWISPKNSDSKDKLSKKKSSPLPYSSFRARDSTESDGKLSSGRGSGTKRSSITNKWKAVIENASFATQRARMNPKETKLASDPLDAVRTSKEGLILDSRGSEEVPVPGRKPSDKPLDRAPNSDSKAAAVKESLSRKKSYFKRKRRAKRMGEGWSDPTQPGDQTWAARMAAVLNEEEYRVPKMVTIPHVSSYLELDAASIMVPNVRSFDIKPDDDKSRLVGALLSSGMFCILTVGEPWMGPFVTVRMLAQLVAPTGKAKITGTPDRLQINLGEDVITLTVADRGGVVPKDQMVALKSKLGDMEAEKKPCPTETPRRIESALRGPLTALLAGGAHIETWADVLILKDLVGIDRALSQRNGFAYAKHLVSAMEAELQRSAVDLSAVMFLSCFFGLQDCIEANYLYTDAPAVLASALLYQVECLCKKAFSSSENKTGYRTSLEQWKQLIDKAAEFQSVDSFWAILAAILDGGRHGWLKKALCRDLILHGVYRFMDVFNEGDNFVRMFDAPYGGILPNCAMAAALLSLLLGQHIAESSKLAAGLLAEQCFALEVLMRHEDITSEKRLPALKDIKVADLEWAFTWKIGGSKKRSSLLTYAIKTFDRNLCRRLFNSYKLFLETSSATEGAVGFLELESFPDSPLLTAIDGREDFFGHALDLMQILHPRVNLLVDGRLEGLRKFKNLAKLIQPADARTICGCALIEICQGWSRPPMDPKYDQDVLLILETFLQLSGVSVNFSLRSTPFICMVAEQGKVDYIALIAYYCDAVDWGMIHRGKTCLDILVERADLDDEKAKNAIYLAHRKGARLGEEYGDLEAKLQEIIKSYSEKANLSKLLPIMERRLHNDRQVNAADLIDGDGAVPYEDIMCSWQGNSLLGIGGFGEVYAGAFDGKRVALKRSHNKFRPNDPVAMAAIKELDILKLIGRHPHLVAFYGACLNHSGHMIFVLELINGPNLSTQMYAEDATMDEFVIKEIMIGVLNGLRYLHARQIIHRDIKPENIMLALDQGILYTKLTDFGISRTITGSVAYTASQTFTPSYAAREVIVDGQYSRQSDIYALAVVWLEMITLKPAWDNQEEQTLLFKIVEENLVPTISNPRDLKPLVYKPWRLMISRCFDVERHQRPSLEELMDLLVSQSGGAIVERDSSRISIVSGLRGTGASDDTSSSPVDLQTLSVPSVSAQQ
eukprot:Clim_evm98s149 gene=Clim_evmTU98s149